MLLPSNCTLARIMFSLFCDSTKEKILYWKMPITHQKVQQLDYLSKFPEQQPTHIFIFCLCQMKFHTELRSHVKADDCRVCVFFPHLPNVNSVSDNWTSSSVHQRLPCLSWSSSKVSFQVFCFNKLCFFLIHLLENHMPSTHTHTKCNHSVHHYMFLSLLSLKHKAITSLRFWESESRLTWHALLTERPSAATSCGPSCPEPFGRDQGGTQMVAAALATRLPNGFQKQKIMQNDCKEDFSPALHSGTMKHTQGGRQGRLQAAGPEQQLLTCPAGLISPWASVTNSVWEKG